MSGAFGSFAFGGAGIGPGNFLNLCQRTATECGVANSLAVQSALPTVSGATGSLGRIVNWVGDGWRDLQMDRDDWAWMRSSVLLGGGVTFPTVAAQASYPLGTGAGSVGVGADSFGKWDIETFRSYPTAVGYRGEIYLDEVSYDVWRDSYMLGAMRDVQTRPVVFAVGPDQSICLGPPPNGLYTIAGDYFVAPSEMVVDTDIPVGLPTRFRMLIVYRAMAKYAAYEAAPDVAQRAAEENARLYPQLLAARSPQIGFAGALA